MHITQRMLEPSRDDAVRLTRSEKTAMLWFANAVATLEELQTSIADRLKMIPGGTELLNELAVKSDELLNEVRKTIPMNQRTSLQNTVCDYEVRMAPKLSSFTKNVIMTGDEFKALVDIARTKCRECTEDDHSNSKCELFQLLTSILPLDDYSGLLCPYNMGEWGN